MWDTAGQERHASIGFAFYRGSNCCVLCFDVSNQESFNRLDFWKKNFLQQASPANPATFPFLVIGNKTDTARVVTRETAQEWCSSQGYEYFETNALTGEGVDAAFTKTAELAMAQTAQNDDAGLPTSLSGAAGAITISPTTEAEATEEKKKKKKKCKC